VLLLPGTFSTGSYYNLDVEGYRFQDTLAREGYYAFAVDYEGSGDSTYPEDGYAVDHDYLVASMRPILQTIRLLRLVPRVDVLGESNGGSIAAELCDDAHRVRSCVLSSMFYVDGTDFYDAVFLDPGFVFFLTHQPNGYLDAGPEMYFNITSRMPPAVAAETLATQPGRFALGHVVDGLGTLPWFDPTRAAVPALIVQGTEDNVATQNDVDLLAADYGSVGGGHATIVRIEGAGMIPRTEAAPYNQIWTEEVLEFLASSPD
jgi:pimeloyl-ACP methyl ester carboxylesterase